MPCGLPDSADQLCKEGPGSQQHTPVPGIDIWTQGPSYGRREAVPSAPMPSGLGQSPADLAPPRQPPLPPRALPRELHGASSLDSQLSLSFSRGKELGAMAASLSSLSFPAHSGGTKCPPHAIIPGSFPSFSRSPQTQGPSKAWQMLSPGSQWRRVSLELALRRAVRGTRGVSPSHRQRADLRPAPRCET